MAYARALMTDTLLTNGKILVVGGTHNTNTATELYDPGFGYTSTTQPQVDALATGLVAAGYGVTLTGTGFTGTAADLTNPGSYGPVEASSGSNAEFPFEPPGRGGAKPGNRTDADSLRRSDAGL